MLNGNNFAQTNPTDPKRGFQAGASHALSDIETINTTNGNLMLNLPLASLPKGRGEIGETIGLTYNSKLYDVNVEQILNNSNEMELQNLLKKSDTGGWQYTNKNYWLEVITRFNNGEVPWFGCNGSEAGKNAYSIKVVMNMPDGSKKTFLPTGFDDIYNDGFFAITPGGYNTSNCSSGPTLNTSSGMTYFSTDGSYIKLVVDYVSGSQTGQSNPWTMYMPDGSKMAKLSNGTLRKTDRNGNHIEGYTDNVGRSISIQNISSTEDHITMTGANSQSVVWKVFWKTITFTKDYKTTAVSNGPLRGGSSTQTITMSHKVVDKIYLPTQVANGTLFYEFHYNTESSLGWGELSSVTLPSTAKAEYEYEMDSFPGTPIIDFILDNAVDKKKLTYDEKYDGVTNQVSDIWLYNIGKSQSITTNPNGSTITQLVLPLF